MLLCVHCRFQQLNSTVLSFLPLLPRPFHLGLGLPSRFSWWNIWSSKFLCVGYSLAAMTTFRIKPVGLISTQIALLLVKPPSAVMVMTLACQADYARKIGRGLAVHLENGIVMTQVGSEFRKSIQVPLKWTNIHLFSVSRSNPTSVELFRLFQPHTNLSLTLVAIIVLPTLLKTDYLLIYMSHIVVLYGLTLVSSVRLQALRSRGLTSTWFWAHKKGPIIAPVWRKYPLCDLTLYDSA